MWFSFKDTSSQDSSCANSDSALGEAYLTDGWARGEKESLEDSRRQIRWEPRTYESPIESQEARREGWVEWVPVMICSMFIIQLNTDRANKCFRFLLVLNIVPPLFRWKILSNIQLLSWASPFYSFYCSISMGCSKFDLRVPSFKQFFLPYC